MKGRRRACHLGSDENLVSDAKAPVGRAILLRAYSSGAYLLYGSFVCLATGPKRVPCQIGQEELLSHPGVLFRPCSIQGGRFPWGE